MPKKPQGLQHKGNAYYLRVRIPADLGNVLEKTERVISLETTDYQQARKKIQAIRAAEVCLKHTTTKTGSCSLASDELQFLCGG